MQNDLLSSDIEIQKSVQSINPHHFHNRLFPFFSAAFAAAASSFFPRSSVASHLLRFFSIQRLIIRASVPAKPFLRQSSFAFSQTYARRPSRIHHLPLRYFHLIIFPFLFIMFLLLYFMVFDDDFSSLGNFCSW